MITDQVPVLLHATDTITHAGVTAALRSRPEIRFADEDSGEPAVVLVIVERLNQEARQLLRSLQCAGHAGVVLVAGEVEDSELLDVVGNGVSAIIRRADATPDTLVRLVKAAAVGEGALPPDLLGRLLSRVSRLQRDVLHPNGWDLAGMSQRETRVLKLVADGFETKEIADQLSYSERTVKSILHDITNRFQLRNRAHAVAFAMREGLI